MSQKVVDKNKEIKEMISDTVKRTLKTFQVTLLTSVQKMIDDQVKTINNNLIKKI